MPSQLGHRERVLRAAEHQEVDRTPCFFAAEEAVQACVMKHFRLSNPLELIRLFDTDTIQISLYKPVPDLSGVETVEDLERLEWPGRESVDVEGYVARAQEARASGLAVMGGAWATIFTAPRRSMGEDRYLMAMLDQPDLIAGIVQKETDCYLDINEALFSACVRNLDVFFFGSDFGTQNSLFIGRELFLRFFKPHIRRLAQQAKGFGLKVMYHTCGAVSEIIPDLIECGIDMLDPVQVAACGMEPPRLAELYKGRIAFHGGISTQTTLPHGTPEQVREEVVATIEVLGPSGYIAGPDQWMMSDVPVENMVAMYEAICGPCA